LLNIQGRMVGDDEAAWAKKALNHLDVNLIVNGMDHIDPKSTYVVVANHESFIDALALLQLPLSLGFVARDELADWPILGPHVRKTRNVVIRPERGRTALRTLLSEGSRILGEGTSVAIFAQGTVLGIEAAFAEGAFELAAREEVPVLGVALSGGHRVWEYPFSSRLRYGCDVSMTVLEPFVVSDPAAAAAEVGTRIRRAAFEGVSPRRFDPDRDGFWDGYRYEIDPAFPELAAKVVAHRRSTGPKPSRRAPL
jgi:1-acyl-sn-glycerol-3-phosphate acyltransferase